MERVKHLAARIELGVHYAMGTAEFDGLCVEEL